MTDWYDAEEINRIYRDSHSATIKELNDVIVMLRTKVTILEKQLKEQSETAEDKIPASVKRKITHLEDLNKNLKENLKERDNLHVPRYYETEFKKLLKENEKLKEDVEYYK